MKERSILFSSPMVRAILDGRKTQTRRIGKTQNPEFTEMDVEYLPHATKGREAVATYRAYPGQGTARHAIEKCPYGRPGDRLWVRGPRAVDRIVLEITIIRVERLQEITEEDAKAEGIHMMNDGSGVFVGREGPGKLVTPWPTAKEAFSDKWNEINGERAPWESNPWVWVVGFKHVER